MEENIKKLLNDKNYLAIKKEISDLTEQDIAEILEDMELEDLVKVYRILPKEIAAEVFSYLSLEIEQHIISTLTHSEAAKIIDNLYADDATDLIEEMPANIVTKILTHTSKETRRDINSLLKYEEDSAGSIMTVEYIDFKETITVKEAIEKIRLEGQGKETINNCYVLDKSRKLLGSVSIKDILLNDPSTKIIDIADDQELFVETITDQETVALMFQKYDLLSMPVVDSEKRMVGIITIDDIVDILQEETTEDIEKMAAITPSDRPYLKQSVFKIWIHRIPWLLILMISATFTSTIIQSYQDALASIVILTAFIPMFMDTAGNAGSQASVTIIRGLAINEIAFKDILKIVWKEARVAILCGLTLAICNYGKLVFFDKVGIVIALVVCLTLVVTVLFAKLIGCTLPLVAKKLGLDPAVMASPFITTAVDAISLIVYFKIATLLLGL